MSVYSTGTSKSFVFLGQKQNVIIFYLAFILSDLNTLQFYQAYSSCGGGVVAVYC